MLLELYPANSIRSFSNSFLKFPNTTSEPTECIENKYFAAKNIVKAETKII